MNNKVIDALNEGRKRELHAILQYMVQHYELEDEGYGKLGSRLKAIAIVEMKHAEILAERILFLGGVPITKPDGEVKKGLSIPELLKVDEKLEDDAIKLYNESAKLCADEGDHVSKEIFEQLLAQEEDHIDEFQKDIDHVEKLGNVYINSLVE